MKIKIINIFAIIISIIISSSMVFSENQCQTNIDCDDNNLLTNDICVKANNINQFNLCEHRSFLEGYKCNTDADCNGAFIYSNDFELKNSCKYNIEYGFKTCEHKVVQKKGYCEMNLDCDDQDIKTFDKCESDNLCSHTELKSFGGKLDDGIYLTEDSFTTTINTETKNYFERIGHPYEEHDINNDPYNYDYVYKHKYKKLNFDYNPLKIIRINNLSKLNDDQSIRISYNNGKYKFNLVNRCNVDLDCNDNNISTNDKCVDENRFNDFRFLSKNNAFPKVCMNTRLDNSCNTDLDCQGRTENPYDLEYCDIYNNLGDKTCKSIFDETALYNTNREFNLFLDYIPKINFLGHLNNGQIEKFNINTKTQEIKEGFDDKAFLLIEMYQDSFEAYQNKYYKEYEENKEKYYKLGFFNKERYLFSKLISLSFNPDEFYSYSKVTKLNNWTLLFTEIEYNNNLFDLTKNEKEIITNPTYNKSKLKSDEEYSNFFN